MPRTDAMLVLVRNRRNLPQCLSGLILAAAVAVAAGCGSAPLKTDDLEGGRIAVVYAFENAMEEESITLMTSTGKVNERMKKLDAIFSERKETIVRHARESLLRYLGAAGLPHVTFTDSDIYSDAVIPPKSPMNAVRRDTRFLKEKGYTHVFIFTFSYVYSHSYMGRQAVYTGFSGYLYRVDDLMDRMVPDHSWSAILTTDKDANGVRTCPLVEFYSLETEDRYGEPVILTKDEPLYYRVILSSFNYFLPSAVESMKSGKGIKRVMEEKKIFSRRWNVDEYLKQFGAHQ